MELKGIKEMLLDMERKAISEGLTRKDFCLLKSTLLSINEDFLGESYDDIEYKIEALRIKNLMNIVLKDKDGVLDFNNKTVNYVLKRALLLPIVLADNGFNVGRLTGLNGYMLLCPVHNESTPSFRVKDYENVFFCFGCGASGNVINYMKYRHNMDFTEAMNFLMKVYLWKQADENGKDYDLIKKYQNTIVSSDFSELLTRAYDRMKQNGWDFMPNSSMLASHFFEDRFTMIERIKNGEADPHYIEREPVERIVMKVNDIANDEYIEKNKKLLLQRTVAEQERANKLFSELLPF